MRFHVLGPLEVWEGGRQIEIGGSKQRAILALLILHANEVVGKDRLSEELWGEKTPLNAAASLHNQISRLRKLLGPDRLSTREWGYVLRCDPEQVDLDEFKRLAQEAEPLPASERSVKLAEALALWRGPALADVVFEGPAAAEVARLDELRLGVLEARIDAELELGHSAAIIGELDSLIAEHPFRERARGQLILALYREDRQAEALEVYRETRRVLADELGLEPSPALRELERAILRQDPSLSTAASAAVEDREIPPMRRRWIVYAALAGMVLAGTAGIVAVAAVRHGSPLPVSAAPEPPGTTTNSNDSPSAAISRTKRVRRQSTTRVGRQRGHQHRTSTQSRTATGKPAAKRAPSGAEPKGRAAKPQRPVASSPARDRARPKAVRIVDMFGGTVLNTRIWTLSAWGTGVDLTRRDNRLEVTMHADAAPDTRWNAMAAGYQTSCSFVGDFDARIDYELVDWPASNGAVVGFNASFQDNVVNVVRKSLAAGNEQYGFSAPKGESRDRETTDTSGTLRLMRAGNLITAYYRRGKRWEELDWARRSGSVHLQFVLWASGTDFAHHEVTVAFDNFVVEAPSSACASSA